MLLLLALYHHYVMYVSTILQYSSSCQANGKHMIRGPVSFARPINETVRCLGKALTRSHISYIQFKTAGRC